MLDLYSQYKKVIVINGDIVKKITESIVSFVLFCTILCSCLVLADYIQDDYQPGKYASSLVLNAEGKVSKALFSPADGIKNVLIDLIDAETKEIKIAIFTLTDKDIAQALVDAQTRGVTVTMVVDPGYVRAEAYSKIEFLIEKNIPIWVYKTQECKPKGYCLMHNKYALFSSTLSGKQVLWTGSFNWTKSANTSNRENVTILEEPTLFAAYEKDFELLKAGSRLANCIQQREEVREPELSEDSWWQNLMHRLGCA